MNKVTFRGGGYNAASMREAIKKANTAPSKSTLPAGATWPFVTLRLGDKSVDFTMAQIHKSVTPTTVESVFLSKTGYFFFRTHDHTNEFGFTTLRISTLLRELQERGYTFEPSLQQNMSVAKAFLTITTAISLAVVITVISLGLIKPNGV